METILAYLNAIHPLTEACAEALTGVLKIRELPKRGYLLKAGHICQNIYFIEQGLLRCFYYKDDREICSWFMKEGDVIVSVESFFRQKSSYESIQSLEDCVLYYMQYKELDAIYRQFPEFNFIGRVLTEKYYCLSEQRLYAMRMMRSQERYEYVLANHPEFILRVPTQDIASYLGIRRETLTRLKRKAGSRLCDIYQFGSPVGNPTFIPANKRL